jgi:hypothetical protein
MLCRQLRLHLHVAVMGTHTAGGRSMDGFTRNGSGRQLQLALAPWEPGRPPVKDARPLAPPMWSLGEALCGWLLVLGTAAHCRVLCGVMLLSA